MISRGGGLDDGRGRLAGESAGLEAARDRLEIFHAHVDAQRCAQATVILPTNRRVRLVGILVAGQENDRGAVGAMGEGNTSIGGSSQGRRHPGDNLEWYSSRRECFR